MYHCEVGWKTKCDLGLSDIFVGSCTLGASSIGSSIFCGADAFCKGGFFCFLPDLGDCSGTRMSFSGRWLRSFWMRDFLCLFTGFLDSSGALSVRLSSLRNLETSFDNAG